MKEHFLLDPGVVFLNHGSFGACPGPVFEAYQRFQRELERQPVEFLALERRLPELLDTARERLAAYVGARPDDIAFVPNASSALNAVARSLELGPGDEVLLGDAEYGGMEILWAYVAARTGATLVRRPFGELDPAGHARRLLLAHRVDERAGERRRGALPPRARGGRAVDRRRRPRAGPDRPRPRSDRRRRLRRELPQVALRAEGLGVPLRAAGSPAADRPAGRLVGLGRRRAFHELHRWQGTRDPSAHLAVPAAIDFQAEHDWPTVRRRCHELLAAHDFGLEPLTDDVRPDARLPPDQLDRPRSSGGSATAPDRGAGGRDAAGWVLRVSVQAYNDEADLRRALAALGELARVERLFALPRDAIGGRAGAAGDDLDQLRADVVQRDAVVGGDALREAGVDELAVARDGAAPRRRSAGRRCPAGSRGSRMPASCGPNESVTPASNQQIIPALAPESTTPFSHASRRSTSMPCTRQIASMFAVFRR